jgi:hypothetical protein
MVEIRHSSFGSCHRCCACQFSKSVTYINPLLPILADFLVAVWLKQWSEAEEQNPKGKTSYYLGVYGAVSLVGLLTVILMIW